MGIPLNLRFLFIILSFFGIGNSILGQTYTTSGLSSDWNDPTAWIKTNPNGCATQNASAIPPLGPVYTPACEIRIIINHPITRTGAAANFGGGVMMSLTVNTGGEVIFTGNVSINNVGAPAFLFQINDGGRFSVAETLSLQAGSVFNLANTSGLNSITTVEVNNLTFLNSGSGQAVNVGSNTVFKVNNQTRLQGGGALNIQGEFFSNTFNSTNSGGNQVNISGDGAVRTTGNMLIDGYPITMSGNAAVLVGGSLDITNSGSSVINLNGPNTNFNVLNFGSSIAAGKTPSGTCFHIPEYGSPNNCSSPLCLEILEIEVSAGIVERVYIFKCSLNWEIPNNTSTQEILDDAEVLIVAGGGGGGRGASAGGGGAGGLLYFPSLTLTPGSIVPVAVGAGGLGSTAVGSLGNNGGNSSFLSNQANGGGGGGSTSAGFRNGSAGGSGGGGAFQAGNVGGLGNQGNNGGSGNNTSQGGGRRFGGGGGGSGSTGAIGPDGSAQNGATGGTGLEYSISGSTVIYAAGGGGTATGSGTTHGAGGSSGTGGAANGAGILRNGRANTGSGGGATLSGTRGNGASGIVIVRQSFKILPVEFLSFSAVFKDQNRKVELNWETGREWQNSHFEIKRSIDNARTWEEVGFVQGIGWSDLISNYSYLDEKLPLSGGLIYYKLKQVDFDGKYAFSKVVSVQIPSVQGFKQNWRIYPNPVSGEEMTIEYLAPNTTSETEITAKLIHSSGLLIGYQSGLPNEVSDWLTEKIHGSHPGLYLLEIGLGRNMEYFKIVKR